LESIASYLQVVHVEATRRGYDFDITKIASHGRVKSIVVTCGQLDYEWAHLNAKLRIRAPAWLAKWEPLFSIKAHPLFRIVPGAVAEWEIR